jgi:hypothetical protein
MDIFGGIMNKGIYVVQITINNIQMHITVIPQ